MMILSWAAISPTQAMTRREPRAELVSGALAVYTASVTRVRQISVERSIWTRVGCWSRDTASTSHQKASSAREAVRNSIAQERGASERGAVTSLLGDKGIVTREINTLQIPGKRI